MVKPVIYLVSDSLGETAEKVIKSALLQFGDHHEYELVREPYVDGREKNQPCTDDSRKRQSDCRLHIGRSRIA